MTSSAARQSASDSEVRDLVVARLRVLSPDTVISVGSDGRFTRDELIVSVERGDRVGEKIAEMQLEWMRSFKDVLAE